MSFSHFRRIRVDRWPPSDNCEDAGKRWSGAEGWPRAASRSTNALTRHAGRASLRCAMDGIAGVDVHGRRLCRARGHQSVARALAGAGSRPSSGSTFRTEIEAQARDGVALAFRYRTFCPPHRGRLRGHVATVAVGRVSRQLRRCVARRTNGPVTQLRLFSDIYPQLSR